MDISECTGIVYEKILRFEPEHATKIIGYILMKHHGEQELAKLASSPDYFIYEVVLEARNELQLFNATSKMLPIQPPSYLQSHTSYYHMNSANDGNTNEDLMGTSYLDSIVELHQRLELLHSVNRRVDGLNCLRTNLEYASAVCNLNRKNGGRFFNMYEYPFKTCHYFNKGFCKNGNYCKYSHHGNVGSEMYGNDAAYDEQAISPRSLAQLESEIVELLKQRGSPISIASLPMAYYDKYRKVLRAEGYQAGSGKSGINLTRLLAQFRNSIRLIDRPHGQHAVVLAEDASKIMGKIDCQNISASQQIYLTFPADSTFSEEDVSNYFSTFGCVQDVRIPCQQRRMFGFVTFVDPETVKMIFEKGNPHYVHGSRVLVKPYKEKPKLVDRKYPYRVEHHVCYSPRYLQIDAEIPSSASSCGDTYYQSGFEELEYQRNRLAALQLRQNFYTAPRLPESKSLDDHVNVQRVESFSYAQNDKVESSDTNKSDHKSDHDSIEGIHLPDNPFSFCYEVDNGISTVI